MEEQQCRSAWRRSTIRMKAAEVSKAARLRVQSKALETLSFCDHRKMWLYWQPRATKQLRPDVSGTIQRPSQVLDFGVLEILHILQPKPYILKS